DLVPVERCRPGLYSLFAKNLSPDKQDRDTDAIIFADAIREELHASGLTRMSDVELRLEVVEAYQRGEPTLDLLGSDRAPRRSRQPSLISESLAVRVTGVPSSKFAPADEEETQDEVPKRRGPSRVGSGRYRFRPVEERRRDVDAELTRI